MRCDCNKHDGPHWLYLDYEWRKRNIEHLQRAFQHAIEHNHQGFELAMMGYLTEEQARIGEKAPHMRAHEDYPYSLLGKACPADLPMIAWTLLQSITEQVQDSSRT